LGGSRPSFGLESPRSHARQLGESKAAPDIRFQRKASEGRFSIDLEINKLGTRIKKFKELKIQLEHDILEVGEVGM
jgi:hypothetical protein